MNDAESGWGDESTGDIGSSGHNDGALSALLQVIAGEPVAPVVVRSLRGVPARTEMVAGQLRVVVDVARLTGEQMISIRWETLSARMDHPAVPGVLAHQAAHFNHTKRVLEVGGSPNQRAIAAHLECLRVDARHLTDRPVDHLPLKHSVPHLHRPRNTSLQALHLLGRVSLGLLTDRETAASRAGLVERLGVDALEELEGLWRKALALPDSDFEGLLAVAQEWEKLSVEPAAFPACKWTDSSLDAVFSGSGRPSSDSEPNHFADEIAEPDLADSGEASAAEGAEGGQLGDKSTAHEESADEGDSPNDEASDGERSTENGEPNSGDSPPEETRDFDRQDESSPPDSTPGESDANTETASGAHHQINDEDFDVFDDVDPETWEPPQLPEPPPQPKKTVNQTFMGGAWTPTAAAQQLRSAMSERIPKKGTRVASSELPTTDDRALAVALAKMFAKSRLRAPRRTKDYSEVPPGKLVGSKAMQAEAQEALGMPITAKPFRRIRKLPDIHPPLTVGLMCDISGSMSGAAVPMGKATWALARAIRQDGGRFAAVTFGRDVRVAVLPREVPSRVPVYLAGEGMERAGSALTALTGELRLWDPRNGIRVLLISSDGYWSPAAERNKAVGLLNLLDQRGVLIYWLPFSGNLDQHQVGEVLDTSDPRDVPYLLGRAIGRAVSAAY